MKPKVLFKKLSLEDTIDNVLWTYDEFNDETLNCFPELKKYDKVDEKIIRNLFTNYYECNEKDIEKSIKHFDNIWSKYNDSYMEAISKYLNIDWNVDTIICRVGLVCIFPRFLKEKSFIVSNNISDEVLIRVCAHEILHFIWFEKWKSMFKDYKEEEFESPHTIWKYSEMVTDAILNSKEINSILKVKERSYDYFYDIENGRIMNKLTQIYSSNKTIEEKIIEGYDLIRSIE